MEESKEVQATEPAKEQPKFVATDAQVSIARELSALLQTMALYKTNITIGDRDSVRFDIHFDKKKLILSAFIYPDGSIETDLYNTRKVTEENPLTKDDLIESKCVGLGDLRSYILVYCDAARKLKK
jgi:hypothetical protein